MIVGVNQYQSDDDPQPDIARISDDVEQTQKRRLEALRNQRDSEAVDGAMRVIGEAARGTDNLLPHILHAVKAGGTLGEISDAMRQEFGTYRETVVF